MINRNSYIPIADNDNHHEEKDPKEIKDPQEEEKHEIKEPNAPSNASHNMPCDPDVLPFSGDSKTPKDPSPNEGELPQEPT